MRALLLPTLVISLGLGLAACGESKSDEEKIVAAINFAFVSTDPDACTEAQTQAFAEWRFEDDGAEAVESCEQNAEAEESPNDPVEVTDVEVDGSEATAEIGLTNKGKPRGQVWVAALVEEDGDWKLNEVTGYAEFDKRKWIAEQKEGFENAHNSIDQQVIDCIAEAYRQRSRPELEEMVLGDSPRAEFEIWEDCGLGS